MPNDGEIREQNGRQEVYFIGQWHPVKQPKQTNEKEYPIDVELKIGNNTYRGKARTETFPVEVGGGTVNSWETYYESPVEFFQVDVDLENRLDR